MPNQLSLYNPRPRLRRRSSSSAQDSYDRLNAVRAIEYPVRPRQPDSYERAHTIKLIEPSYLPPSRPAPSAPRFQDLVKQATKAVGAYLPPLHFAKRTVSPAVSKPPRRTRRPSTFEPKVSSKAPKAPIVIPAYVNVKVPAKPVSYTTPTGVPLTYKSSEKYIAANLAKLGLITQVPATPEHTVSQLVQQGTYHMSKTGLKSLANTYPMSKSGRRSLSNTGMFRGRNTTSTRNAPVAISRRMNVVNKPRMATSSKGIVIAHKEYMSNIVSSATTLTFNATALTLNPGKIAAFPWLSTIAGNFDKYRIMSCKISLVSNQPTTTAGRIGVGFDYDSTDPLPADRTDFFSLTHHAECSAWDSLEFDIPLQGGTRFVNSHTITDSKLIDYGQVIIMSDQIVATSSNLGDAIIEYVVELLDPSKLFCPLMFWTG